MFLLNRSQIKYLTRSPSVALMSNAYQPQALVDLADRGLYLREVSPNGLAVVFTITERGKRIAEICEELKDQEILLY